MTRRFPVVATIVVIAAVAVMIGLGVWQLQRTRWKEGLLAQYARAETLPPITWPTAPLRSDQLPLFRHATGVCLRPIAQRAVAGENRRGEPGYVHIIDCSTGAEGPGMSVEVGWSKDPNARFSWPTWVEALLLGWVTETMPSLLMLIEVALAGMVMPAVSL